MKFNLFGVGVFGDTAAQIDPTHRALRTSLRPPEPGTNGGSYALAFNSGVMAAGLAAGSPIFVFRWPAGSALMALVKLIRVTAGTDGTAFAQGSTIFDLVRASKIPAQYTAGANVTVTGKDGAKASRFANNPIQIANVATGDIAVSNTAALAAGSPAPTLDTNARAILINSVGAVPANYAAPQPGYLIDPSEAGRQPEELMPTEGLIVRATVPITGTWKFGVTIEYDAVDPQRYFWQ